MATMNISLPGPMKDWVEAQAESGLYSNASDYVRDLIRRDQIRREKIANMQRLVDEGLASGISTRSMDDLLEEAKRRFAEPQSAKQRVLTDRDRSPSPLTLSLPRKGEGTLGEHVANRRGYRFE